NRCSTPTRWRWSCHSRSGWLAIRCSSDASSRSRSAMVVSVVIPHSLCGIDASNAGRFLKPALFHELLNCETARLVITFDHLNADRVDRILCRTDGNDGKIIDLHVGIHFTTVCVKERKVEVT